MRPNVTRNAPARHVGGSLRGRVAAAALATLTAVGFGACTDSPTAVSSAPPRAPAGAPSVDLTIQAAQVLYDQSANRGALLSGDDYYDGTTTNLSADEFVVPEGTTWSVTRVEVWGQLQRTTLRFSFRADNGGEPGAILASFDLAPDNPEAVNFLEPNRFTLTTMVALDPGTYWLVVDQSGTNHDGFDWQTVWPSVGLPMLVSFDGGQTWRTIGPDPTQSDVAFALYGVSLVGAAADLGTTLTGLGLPQGTTMSLKAKLNLALAAIEARNYALACRILQDFINEVAALSGKKLTEAQANDLIDRANDIRAAAGC